MAGLVDETQDQSVGQRCVVEAQLEKEAALLFLGQEIRIDAGQRLNQDLLAVVYVSGCDDDQGASTIRLLK